MTIEISVAMATYNGERYLRRQLDSLAEQEKRPKELHVGDDGSTDATEEIVRSFAGNAPFPVYFQRNNAILGYGENFLRTASRCAGDWIAFCDQDDIWKRAKLAVIERAIEASPASVSLIAHNASVIDEMGRPLSRQLLERLSNEHYPRFTLPATWLCAGFRQVFRRDLVINFDIKSRIETPNSTLGDTGCDKRPHDSWIPFLANMTGSILTLDADLVKYRRHASNATFVVRAANSASAPLKNNADVYRGLADWHERAANALVCAAERPNWDVAKGCERLRLEAVWLRRRAEFYGSREMKDRISLLVQQLASGAYQRSWTLNAASLLKDVAFAIGGRSLLTGLSRLTGSK